MQYCNLIVPCSEVIKSEATKIEAFMFSTTPQVTPHTFRDKLEVVSACGYQLHSWKQAVVLPTC